jgi:hypothetical protein
MYFAALIRHPEPVAYAGTDRFACARVRCESNANRDRNPWLTDQDHSQSNTHAEGQAEPVSYNDAGLVDHADAHPNASRGRIPGVKPASRIAK